VTNGASRSLRSVAEAAAAGRTVPVSRFFDHLSWASLSHAWAMRHSKSDRIDRKPRQSHIDTWRSITM
jgi:hypothetical protein